MANLSQTAANVGIGSIGTRVAVGQAGESITQGMPIYKSTADTKWYQADANASATTAAATAIAITAASANGFFVYQSGEDQFVNLGATLTVGETYVVSATKGAICPIADLTTGDYPTILGIATTTALIRTMYKTTGVAK